MSPYDSPKLRAARQLCRVLSRQEERKAKALARPITKEESMTTKHDSRIDDLLEELAGLRREIAAATHIAEEARTEAANARSRSCTAIALVPELQADIAQLQAAVTELGGRLA